MSNRIIIVSLFTFDVSLLLNRIAKVQECDATDDDSSTRAGNKKYHERTKNIQLVFKTERSV